MARRSGKKGQWLVTDDYTGITRYSSEMQQDYWGNYTRKPLKRNLQEIASPLSDPEPVPFYRPPTYEHTTAAQFSVCPATVGLTSKPTPPSLAGDVFGWNAGIGDAVIGSTFLVR